MYNHSVQLANWMLEQGIQPGDLVALYLTNSAEFIMLLYATFAIGASAATINYNLEGKALMHCLAVAQTKLLIIDQDAGCQKRIGGSREEIAATGTAIVTFNEVLKEQIMARPVVLPDDSFRKGVKPEFPFVLVCIYPTYSP